MGVEVARMKRRSGELSKKAQSRKDGRTAFGKAGAGFCKAQILLQNLIFDF